MEILCNHNFNSFLLLLVALAFVEAAHDQECVAICLVEKLQKIAKNCITRCAKIWGSMTKYDPLIYQFLNLVMSCEFLFQGPYWLYVIWRRICRRPVLILCCCQLPRVLFTVCSGSTLLSSTYPHPCLPLPLLLFLLPWPLAGLVIWIMNEFCKSN
jgi:hypothetical protein